MGMHVRGRAQLLSSGGTRCSRSCTEWIDNRVAMSRKHQDTRWVKVRATVKPRLMAALPHPCPRCGHVMERGQALDLGHRLLDPTLAFEPANLRLEHRACNRRDGQRITSAKRRKPEKGMPRW